MGVDRAAGGPDKPVGRPNTTGPVWLDSAIVLSVSNVPPPVSNPDVAIERVLITNAFPPTVGAVTNVEAVAPLTTKLLENVANPVPVWRVSAVSTGENDPNVRALALLVITLMGVPAA